MRSPIYVFHVLYVALDFVIIDTVSPFMEPEVSFCICKSDDRKGLSALRKIGATIESYDSMNTEIERKLDRILGFDGGGGHSYVNDVDVNDSGLLHTAEDHVFPFPASCDEAYRLDASLGNITNFNPLHLMYILSLTPRPIRVYCNMHFMGGGWLVVQRRMDGSVDFYRDWRDYERGFGNVNGEFWFGLDKLHELTTQRRHELIVVLHDKRGTVYERYDRFVVGSREDFWPLVSVGTYSGEAGDALGDSVGQQFSTADWDHDTMDQINCAQEHRGAWWFNGCRQYLISHLNGEYVRGSSGTVASFRGRGIAWRTHRKYFSYPRVEMMIRPWRNDAIPN